MMRNFFPLVFIHGYFGFSIFIFLGLREFWLPTKAQPDQPIAFSHNIHVVKLGLSCQECHEFTEKSSAAGIPSVEKCMSCHKTTAADKPEIKKLLAYYQNNEPVPWNRVHWLADFVYFSHKRHIKAGLDCSACHGEVKSMDANRKVKSLNMGWCLDCHRLEGASTDCLTCHK
jgi:hypothetical protein